MSRAARVLTPWPMLLSTRAPTALKLEMVVRRSTTRRTRQQQRRSRSVLQRRAPRASQNPRLRGRGHRPRRGRRPKQGRGNAATESGGMEDYRQMKKQCEGEEKAKAPAPAIALTSETSNEMPVAWTRTTIAEVWARRDAIAQARISWKSKDVVDPPPAYGSGRARR